VNFEPLPETQAHERFGKISSEQFVAQIDLS
jgi:hypothetical protein